MKPLLSDVSLKGDTSFSKMFTLLADLYHSLEEYPNLPPAARLKRAREAHEKARQLAQLAFEMRASTRDLVSFLEDVEGIKKQPIVHRYKGDGRTVKSFIER